MKALILYIIDSIRGEDITKSMTIEQLVRHEKALRRTNQARIVRYRR